MVRIMMGVLACCVVQCAEQVPASLVVQCGQVVWEYCNDQSVANEQRGARITKVLEQTYPVVMQSCAWAKKESNPAWVCQLAALYAAGGSCVTPDQAAAVASHVMAIAALLASHKKKSWWVWLCVGCTAAAACCVVAGEMVRSGVGPQPVQERLPALTLERVASCEIIGVPAKDERFAALPVASYVLPEMPVTPEPTTRSRIRAMMGHPGVQCAIAFAGGAAAYRAAVWAHDWWQRRERVIVYEEELPDTYRRRGIPDMTDPLWSPLSQFSFAQPDLAALLYEQMRYAQQARQSGRRSEARDGLLRMLMLLAMQALSHTVADQGALATLQQSLQQAIVQW